ncbi:MAG: hypothetical protein ACOX5M_06940 [Bacillota bacterium]|jgi:hypothetical protein
METDRTLSDIARSVLTESHETDPRSLREKAGLLALLNLLGILESFYAEGDSQKSSINLIKSMAEDAVLSPPQPEAKETDLTSSVMAAASKLLSGPQGGIDPALIGTLMGALSAMTKARNLSPQPPSEPAETAADSDSQDSGAEAKDKPPAEPKTPASPLQQILGIDPRIITLALNVLADLMKARNTGEKQPGQESSREDGSHKQPTEVTVTSDGKTVVIPTAKSKPRERLYHKPGLGIYRKTPDKAPGAAE